MVEPVVAADNIQTLAEWLAAESSLLLRSWDAGTRAALAVGMRPEADPIDCSSVDSMLEIESIAHGQSTPPTGVEDTQARFPAPILALALAAFAIGTTEFVIMGILPNVAQDLSVSTPSAGLLVSGYALGVSVGAPLVATMTARWPRKKTLLVLLGLFMLGNVLSALAPTYPMLILGRVISSLAHGSFFGIGSVLASRLVAPRGRAAAIALMFSGLTLANVLGVPFGTLIGQAWGWRATFWSVAAAGVLATGAVARLVVEPTPKEDELARSGEWRVLRDPRVWLALALTVFGFGGIFTAFTYITPMLEQVTGLTPAHVTAVLFLFGVGLTAGNVLGGKLADSWPFVSMLWILGGLTAVELLLSLFLTRPAWAIVGVCAWGVVAFAAVPGLQTHVVDKAAAAPTLASTLNIAAFNLGNAGGAWLGGALLAAHWSLRSLPIFAASIALVVMAIAAVSSAVEGRAERRATTPL